MIPIDPDEGSQGTTVGETVGEESTVLKTVRTTKRAKTGIPVVVKKPAARKSAATKPAKKAPAKRKRKHTGESSTSPRRIAAIEVTQTQALEYRKLGYSFAQIATELGYAGPQGAHAAVQSALNRIIREPAEDVLRLELERMDAMFVKPFAAACNGDLMAVGTVLNIMARKAKLLGLDAPSKVDNTIANKNGVPLKTEVHNMTPDDMDAAAKRLLDKY